MISLTAALWKEATDTRDDAIIDSKIMDFPGKDGIETSNTKLSEAMDTGDNKDKIDNAIKKRVNAKPARKEAHAKEKARKNHRAEIETRSQRPQRMVKVEN